MTKTKRALLMSGLALTLCVSMLIGSTFAWFTDSVTSANNIIKSGNLDVELYYQVEGQNDWTKVTDTTNVFMENALWEPGHTEVVKLKVVNEGTLALKYQLGVNIDSETGSVNVNGKDFLLSDYIKYGIVEDDKTYTRDEAVAAVDATATTLKSAYTKNSELLPGKEAVVTMVVYMPTSVNNDANYAKDAAIPTINLGINLFATQFTYEKDSFDDQYDANAHPLAWDGSVADVPAEVDGVITISTPEQLAGFAAAVNDGTSFSGKTVKLGADINLGDRVWAPIGTCDSAAYFQGTFDGQGHTIYNLNVDKSTDTYKFSTAGLFGWIDAAAATIKNVKVDGATVKGSHWVGVIAGYMTGEISNCTVTNATVTGYNVNDDANGDKVGGIVGYMNSGAGKLDGNTVTNSTITGYRDVAGLAGAVATTNTVTNNTVEEVVITYSADYVGKIVSPKTAVVVDTTNTAKNVTIIKALTVSTAAELAAALTSNENIQVVLANDIDLPITSLGAITAGSGEYKLGGANTETITIDLNGHKLNITTTYWSAIGAKNNDATITIKNGTMTSTGNSAGTWNAFDVRLSNCNYVIENVVFEKAVALDNAGKTVTLKNVTINETHDYYALWITAEGQTVEIDGLTVNSAGRGIKIDEQYVDAPAEVTLKVSNADINSKKKGAIMVKSAAGADITLSDVNIDDVVDATNAVWVDADAEAYENMVTVTGGTKICESKVITDSDALNKALNEGQTELLLAAGEYDVNNGKNKTLTFTGLSKKAVIKVVGGEQGEAGGQLDYGLDSSTVTFNNLTIKTNNKTYAGYARLTGTYNDCVFENCYCLNGNSVFTNCTLNVSGDQYNIWTWGAPTATFNNCTFNSDGKAMLLYGTANTKLTLDGCTFNDKGGLSDLKAAIEIGNDYGKSYELIVNNTTVNGYEINDKGINTGTTLWANKNSMGTDKLNVVVDGVDVY